MIAMMIRLVALLTLALAQPLETTAPDTNPAAAPEQAEQVAPAEQGNREAEAAQYDQPVIADDAPMDINELNDLDAQVQRQYYEEVKSHKRAQNIFNIATLLLSVLAIGLSLWTLIRLNNLRNDTSDDLEAIDKKIGSLGEQIDRQGKSLAVAQTQQRAAKPATQAAATATAAAAPTIVSAKPAPSQPKKPELPTIIYLPRASKNMTFERASREFSMGNTMFELTTPDAVHGAFVVSSDAGAQRMALLMPTENLTTACEGDNIEVSSGAQRIVTDEPGVAVFENGVWRIVRKARIHYER